MDTDMVYFSGIIGLTKDRNDLFPYSELHFGKYYNGQRNMCYIVLLFWLDIQMCNEFYIVKSSETLFFSLTFSEHKQNTDVLFSVILKIW